jgi:hypothetical protein
MNGCVVIVARSLLSVVKSVSGANQPEAQMMTMIIKVIKIKEEKMTYECHKIGWLGQECRQELHVH